MPLLLQVPARRRPRRLAQALTTLVAMGVLAAPAAWAASGKLLLTGGVSSIDGAAGGGLTPWATIGSYASGSQVGATAFVTGVQTQDYRLVETGVALGLHDRVELSLARQHFDTRDNLAPLGLAGTQLKQTITGIKVRVAGDAVLDADTLMPQVAVGLQYRHTDAGALGPVLTGPLGARDHGVDAYVSATKLFLAQGILVNGTLRASKANQNGLLGFGGARSDRYKLLPELSVAKLLRKDLAVGAEYRRKPNNLDQSVLGAGALKEDDWYDVFVAWAPTKQVSLTLAYVDLGRIAPAVQPRRQNGAYLSAQFAF